MQWLVSAGLAKSPRSHYVPLLMNDLFDKNRPRRNLEDGRVISIRGSHRRTTQVGP
jgi:hypothetical protein